jgi:uncharacterized protein YbdZ (MbtH family)
MVLLVEDRQAPYLVFANREGQRVLLQASREWPKGWTFVSALDRRWDCLDWVDAKRIER